MEISNRGINVMMGVPRDFLMRIFKKGMTRLNDCVIITRCGCWNSSGTLGFQGICIY